MKKNSVYAHTQTKETYSKDKGITAKHWKVYYYLLSVSKFDSQRIEDHRYVYKKELNISAACRTLGVKSTQTFYNALTRLEKHGLVKVASDYYLLYARNWIDIDKDVLTNLVKYAKTREQDIDLLRVFLILKKLDKIAQSSQDRSFTLRDLCSLLNHGTTSSIYYMNIRIYLALLCFWGLIELKTHIQNHPQLGHYTVYHLQLTKENNLNPDFLSDIEAEVDTPLMTERLKEKLSFSFPEIVERD